MKKTVSRQLLLISRSHAVHVSLLALAVIALLLPAGGTGTLERAEVYFMTGARSMVERGDWLIPYYRGTPFFDKPALTYWLVAAAFRVFGVTPGAARVVPALCALLCLILTVRLGAQLFDRRSALAGGVVLATTLPFLSFGRIVMSDMPMTLCTTAAAALIIRALHAPAPAIIYPTIGAVLGFGFLAKGPIALILPCLAILPFVFGMRRRAPIPSPGAVLLAVCCFAATGLSWYVSVVARFGWAPLDYFFLRENLERFSGSTFDLGRGPGYYLITYFAQGFPWSLLLPWAVMRAIKEKEGDSARHARRLLFALALMVAPLSLARGKLDYYLLPLYPLAALVIGRHLATVEWRRAERAYSRAVSILVCLVLLAVPVVSALTPRGWRAEGATQLLSVLVAGVVVVALGPAVLDTRPFRVVALLAAGMAVVFGILVYVWQPAFGAGQPNRAILKHVLREHAIRPEVRLALCEDPTHVQRDIIFSTRVETYESCDFAEIARSNEPCLMLLGDAELNAAKNLHGALRIKAYPYLPMRVFSLNGLREPPLPEQLHLMANEAQLAATSAP
ncbi:MAG: glycosyltransferase family 39 protein [Vicinamibacteria bacterium]|nr:glycosyltransferase family 39 protein [Vicinamibacteria bacterium]